VGEAAATLAAGRVRETTRINQAIATKLAVDRIRDSRTADSRATGLLHRPITGPANVLSESRAGSWDEGGNEGGGPEDQKREQLTSDTIAFASLFSETPSLAAVWKRACGDKRSPSRSGFNAARKRFWEIVVDHSIGDSDVQLVRRLIRNAGFRFEVGSSAPVLALNVPLRQRRLSIDHAASAGRSGRWLDPANLRFMMENDNVERRDLFDSFDLPNTGWKRFWRMPSRLNS
jgi:hypothetical protein